jgi:hypothetical protein
MLPPNACYARLRGRSVAKKLKAETADFQSMVSVKFRTTPIRSSIKRVRGLPPRTLTFAGSPNRGMAASRRHGGFGHACCGSFGRTIRRRSCDSSPSGRRMPTRADDCCRWRRCAKGRIGLTRRNWAAWTARRCAIGCIVSVLQRPEGLLDHRGDGPKQRRTPARLAEFSQIVEA